MENKFDFENNICYRYNQLKTLINRDGADFVGTKRIWDDECKVIDGIKAIKEENQRLLDSNKEMRNAL
jgi:hypothetical protein